MADRGDFNYEGDATMTVLRVMASRHSAFYSPLLGAIAGGFLQAEGVSAQVAHSSAQLKHSYPTCTVN